MKPARGPLETSAYDRLPAGVALIVGECVTYVNPAAAAILEAEEPALLVGRSLFDFLHPLDQARASAHAARASAGALANPPTQLRVRTCKGGMRVIGLTSVGEFDSADAGLLIVFMDMTAHSEMAARLRESDEHFRAMLENMQDCFYRTDARGITRFVCPAVRNILGFETHEIIGRPAADFYPHPEDRGALKAAILRDGVVRDFPGQMVCKDGRVIDISVSSRALYDDEGNFAGVEGIWRDITERRRLERELERRASTDELTGASNRSTFLERFAERLGHCRRHRRPLALLILDLDHFKRVNDRYGHLVGDCLLQHFARVVRTTLRVDDYFGRLGGEEFGVLLESTGAAEAREAAERIRLAVCGAPFPADEHTNVTLTVSIGAAQGEPESDEPSTLLERADRALYRAKRAGRNRVAWDGTPHPERV